MKPDFLTLALEFSEALANLALMSSTEPHRTTVRVLSAVFPALLKYNIKRDGSDLRWRAMNEERPEQDIVYTHLMMAQKMVRDWILEECDAVP